MNIAGEDVILGAEYVRDKQAHIWKTKHRFARTPITDADDVPRGSYCHIGEGVWLHRCRSCDDFILSYAPIGYLYEFARHEATHPELVEAGIAGWNVGLLG